MKKQIFDLLDSYVENGYWDLKVYEESYSIIKHHHPDHGLTDIELENITYEWHVNER